MGQGAIEGQVCAARLEHAQQRDGHVEATLDAQAHQHVFTDAQLSQPLRHLVGPRVQLCVREALLRPCPYGDGVRRACFATASTC